MKRRWLLLGFTAIVLLFGLGWSHDLWGLWGTWQGDGSLDVLGDSPLDGAVVLKFSPDGTGNGSSPQGEAAFTYSVYQRDLLLLEVEDGLTYGIEYSLDGGMLSLAVDDTAVIYTKQ